MPASPASARQDRSSRDGLFRPDEGLWFSPAREAIDAFVATTQRRVTGDVRLALSASSSVVAGRRSEYALYSEQLASYSTGETFPHQAAEGFITLKALEVELVAQLNRDKAAV